MVELGGPQKLRYRRGTPRNAKEMEHFGYVAAFQRQTVAAQ